MWFIFPQIAGLGRGQTPRADAGKGVSPPKSACMTLFLTAVTNSTPFKHALDKYFDGKPDQLTLDLLGKQQS